MAPLKCMKSADADNTPLIKDYQIHVCFELLFDISGNQNHAPDYKILLIKSHFEIWVIFQHFGVSNFKHP